MTNLLKRLLAGLLAASVVAPAALAQGGNTGSLGGGKASGPIMSLEELRACIQQQKAIGQRRADIEAERKALDEEKAAIDAENESLKSARASIQAHTAEIEAANARRAELASRIKDWNQRWEDFENSSNRSGPSGERKRRTLMEEQGELTKAAEELKSAPSAADARAGEAALFNERAKVLQQRVATWNERNARAVKASSDAVQQRDLWTVECGNRRYLIDDEIAIKKGQ